MVIEPKQTYIAYRCPHCGEGVISAAGIFSLKADMLRLKCQCGESVMSVTETGDSKVRINVPCLICPQGHTYTVSKNIFFGRDLFMLQCPYSDINIGFMGEYEKISQELENTKAELLEMMSEETLRKLSEADEEDFTDPQVFDVIMFVIRDLEAENKISCKCEDGESDLEVEVLPGGILVRCRRCGAKQLIPTDSLLGAHAFLHCDSLTLE